MGGRYQLPAASKPSSDSKGENLLKVKGNTRSRSMIGPSSIVDVNLHHAALVFVIHGRPPHLSGMFLLGWCQLVKESKTAEDLTKLQAAMWTFSVHSPRLIS
jgi:hypothetical protein